MTRNIFGSALALSLVAPVTAAAPAKLQIEPAVATTHIDGTLVIDTQGAVESYRPEPSRLSADDVARVERLVKTMHFEPVVEDGRPVRAETRMRVTLAGSLQPDGTVSARVDNVTFPNETCGCDDGDGNGPAAGVHMRVRHRAAVTYPADPRSYGFNADVLVAVRVGLDGRIEDAAVRQSALLDARGNPDAVADMLAAFERQTLRSIKRWQVDVKLDEGTEPTPRALSGVVQFSFRSYGSRDPKNGEWRWETRSEKRASPWLPPEPGEMLVGVSDVTGSEVASDSSRFRLRTPVTHDVL